MNQLHHKFLVFAISGLCALVIWSDFRVGQAQPTRNQESPDEMFRALDANRDGKLTLDEAPAGSRPMMQRLFEMSGKPNTGSISREEFGQLVERHRRGENPANRENPTPPGSRLNPSPNGDANRPNRADGPLRLSRNDLRRLMEQFDQIDANRDGVLDAGELQNGINRGNPPERPGDRPAGNTPPNRSGNDRPAARADTPAEQPRGNNPLQGTWRGWVVDGRGENPNGGHLEMELRIEGNRMSAREISANPRAPGGAGADGLGAGTFVLTSTGNTGNLDATGTSGQQSDREFQGIYELDGNTLKWCVGNNGRPRPRELATGRGNYLMVLRRQ